MLLIVIVNVVEEIMFFIMEIKLACRWMPLEPCHKLQNGTTRTERLVLGITTAILAFVTPGKMGASVLLLKRVEERRVQPGTIVIKPKALTVAGADA
jgi:hypothetical protein